MGDKLLSGFALIGMAVLAASPARLNQEPAPAPAMVALGDSVFHGKVGAALCYVCHGPKGKGVTGLGPDLTDKEWTNGDGTMTFLAKTIADGVMKPKKFAAPMPPKGGGQLNEAQVTAAAAYVWSLSHPAK